MPSGRNVTVADAVTALRGLEPHLCNEGVPTPLSAPASAPPCLRVFWLENLSSQKSTLNKRWNQFENSPKPGLGGLDTHSVFSPKAPRSLRSRVPHGNWLHKAVFVGFPAVLISRLHFPLGFLGLPPKQTPGAGILAPPRAIIQRIWTKMVPFTDPSLTQD